MAGAAYVAPPRAVPVGRLAAFAFLSLGFHVLTLGIHVPGDGAGASSGPTARVLHAELSPGKPELSADPDAAPPAQSGQASSGTPATAPSGAAAGTGPDIPLPDKWYSAAEVDVRAAQLTRETLDYPLELSGSRVTAQVRIRLFIDERGAVRKVELARGTSHAAFERAARRAWDHVKFSPAMKDGVAVKSQKLLEVEFEPEDLPRR